MAFSVVVLISGGGTNLQALIDEEKAMNRVAVQGGEPCPYHICAVFSDRKDAYGVERAKAAGIPVEIVSPYAVMGREKASVADAEEKRLAVSQSVLSLAE